MTGALIALQAFQLAFLLLHDFVPLGRLNDVRAVQAADPRAKLMMVTLLSAAPFVFGLALSLVFLARPWPGWLLGWLWVTYGGLMLGQLRAWWVPYLLVSEPARAARYQAMFGATHAFLPERNGMRPNTLHIVLHASTLATLVLLGFATFQGA
jgi:hypothetical protein